MLLDPNEVFSPGDDVSVDVVWPDGRTTRMVGKLIVVKRGEVYVETSRGCVVGDVESLERA